LIFFCLRRSTNSHFRLLAFNRAELKTSANIFINFLL
jgi:hypothetical protein